MQPPSGDGRQPVQMQSGQEKERMVGMKNGKTPTLAQKKFLRSHGLLPEAWLIVKDTPGCMEVVSRAEISRCRMRQIEGAGKKPRTRRLDKGGI